MAMWSKCHRQRTEGKSSATYDENEGGEGEYYVGDYVGDYNDDYLPL